MLTMLSFLIFAYWIGIGVYMLQGWSKIKPLPMMDGTTKVDMQKAFQEKRLPLVSVIIAAKEEDGQIGPTIRSLIGQDYPRLEIIAVNDRSEDGTGATMERLKLWSDHQRGGSAIPIKVVHITSLPKGWLGKNHAMYQGYLQAKGQLLLFTDADIIFQPDTITRAVSFLRQEEADHLTLTPRMISSTMLLRSFVHLFLFSLSFVLRPWLCNDDKQTKIGMGVGAFNLMGRKAYETIGTHESIRMRPDDDLQLGMRVKQSGLRQRYCTGFHNIAVEWYGSLKEALQGLEKNMFSGFQYSFVRASIGVFGLLLMYLFPFIAVFFASGWGMLLYLMSIAIMLFLYGYSVRLLNGEWAYEAFIFPVSVGLLVYIMVRAVYVTISRKGIYWRGTFYSLQDLKRMRDGGD